MTKAVFLDRDGIIIRERGAYSSLLRHVQLVEGIGDFLKRLQEAGFLLIVVSNQGGIARGYYSHDHVYVIHQHIVARLAAYGVQMTDWFYCPHHEKIGHCLCRKPGSLMLEKAIALHRIAPEQSYLIGDKETDVEAGQRVGVTAIQVPSNINLAEYPPISGI